MQKHLECHHDILKGRVAVHPGDALYVSGLGETREAAAKTARNKIYNKTYPFPLTRVGSRWVVTVVNLMAALGLSEPSQELTTEADHKPKRRPGRPRKLANTKVEVSHV